MKAAELILAVGVLLCGLGAAAATYARRERLAGVTAAAGFVLCSVWLLLRTG